MVNGMILQARMPPTSMPALQELAWIRPVLSWDGGIERVPLNSHGPLGAAPKCVAISHQNPRLWYILYRHICFLMDVSEIFLLGSGLPLNFLKSLGALSGLCGPPNKWCLAEFTGVVTPLQLTNPLTLRSKWVDVPMDHFGSTIRIAVGGQTTDQTDMYVLLLDKKRIFRYYGWSTYPPPNVPPQK